LNTVDNLEQTGSNLPRRVDMAVKYLVSGGEGALGKTVISMLLQRGEKVRILMSELSDTRIYRNNPNIEICYGISTDKDSMIEFFDLEDPRSAVLFHTDEYVSLSDATNLTMRRVNVIGAENIVDMCLKRKVGKLVYLSSAYALNPEVKGEDLTIHFDRNKVEGEYAKSKAEAAAYVMEKVSLNRLNAVMVLPTFIIGPGYSQDYEINKVLNSYLNNGTIPPKQGGRAFVDVRDVANAMLALADKGEPGAGYIVSGDYKTSGEFFQDVNEIQGNDAPVKTASKLVMSKSLAKLVDFYYKITHKENPKEAYTLFSDNPDARFEDNSKGILPELTISFKDSLKDTIEGAQHGGVQAASAAVQSSTERKTSADAMEARLKQQQNVASKAHAPNPATAEAAMRPAHQRFAAAAAAARAAKAEEEEKKADENKSIMPQSTLKDPDEKITDSDEPKLNSETTFRFGGTPTKFTSAAMPEAEKPKSIIPQTNKPEAPKAEAPKAAEPAKSIIPPAAPKAEPAKSIIPPTAPKAEAPKAEAPKAEAPKPAAPATAGFPRPGFARTQPAPSAAPAAKDEPVKPINSAFKAPEPKEKPAPSNAGFPRAGFTRPQPAPSAAPAAKDEPVKPINSAFKAPEPKAKPAPSNAGFPRPSATPSSGFARPNAAPSAAAGFQRPTAAPTAAPSAAPKQAPSNPINSAFTSGNSEKLGSSDSAGFLRPSSNSAVTFPSPSATPAAATRTEPISSAFKSVGAPANSNSNAFKSNQPAPAPKAEPEKPSFSASVSEPTVDDLFNDLEKEIESYGSSDGPVVPPGIFAPPPKPGQ
jgi:nucleoside-diphosphate-sugar epimerase